MITLVPLFGVGCESGAASRMAIVKGHGAGESSLHGPRTYCIRVAGVLDEVWADRLGGMAISRASSSEADAVTTLLGRLRDQAALSGVLNTLYEIHLPILSVEALPDEDQE